MNREFFNEPTTISAGETCVGQIIRWKDRDYVVLCKITNTTDVVTVVTLESLETVQAVYVLCMNKSEPMFLIGRAEMKLHVLTP